MIIGNLETLVSAGEVEHKDFKRIFQCPICHSTLTSRQGYIRNGSSMPPTFVHPDNGISCTARNSYEFTSTSRQNALALINQGQSNKKLERAFLNCIEYLTVESGATPRVPSMLWSDKTYLFERLPHPRDLRIQSEPWTESYVEKRSHLKKKIEYNKISISDFLDPDILIESAIKVIKSPNLSWYVDQKVKEFGEEILVDRNVMDGFLKKKDNSHWQSYYSRLYSKDIGNFSVKYLIEEHISHIRGILRYINRSLSKENSQSLIESLLFGSLALPVMVDDLLASQELTKYKNSRKNQLFLREAHNLQEAEGMELPTKSPVVFRTDFPDYIQSKAWQLAQLELENILEELADRIAKRRQVRLEFLRKLPEDLFEKILENPLFVDKVFIDLYNSKETSAVQFIRFISDELISLIKRYDWSILPLFYKDILF